MSENIGIKIKKLRMNQVMSQEDMADKLGVSRQIVSKWENDQATPSTENIQALCDLFHVESNNFLGEETSEKKDDSRLVMILSFITLAISLATMIVSLVAFIFGEKANEVSSTINITPSIALMATSLALILFSLVLLAHAMDKNKKEEK